MKNLCPYILFSITLLLQCSCREAPKAPTLENPPNIVVILTDDQGYQDLASYGAPDILTPNLDNLAAEGTRLTDFYASQAVCSASRAGLLTGAYPNRLGISGAFMPNSDKGLNPEEITIAEMLKARDYSTAVYGKWHLGDHPDFLPTRQGFDEFFGIPYSNDMWPHHPQQGSVFNFDALPLYQQETVIDTLNDQTMLTTQITEKSIDFINRNKDNPFFLYIAHPQPHVPLFVSDKFKGRSERGLYGDVIMEIDWSVGQVINALKENGLEKNTLVIFTSDNGPWLSYGEHSGSALPLREGKGTTLEGGQRVPCIMWYPGKIPAGKKLNSPMMNIDLLPTIAEIAGTALPENKIDGVSHWALIRGKSQENPKDTYFYYYRVNELHSVRHKDWKMYYPHTYRSLNGRKGGENGLPAPYEYLTIDSIELYNLKADISEKHNVAQQYPEMVAHIDSLAHAMRQQLGDRLYETEGSENRKPGIRDWEN